MRFATVIATDTVPLVRPRLSPVATSEVLLIGSTSAQHCAEQLVRAAREAALGVIVVSGDFAVNHEHERVLTVHGMNLLAAKAQYLAAARADLETD